MKKALKGLVLSLAAVSCLAFAACTPSNLEKAEKKMAKEGYVVKAYEVEAEGFVGGITATKSEGILDTDTITALLFESKDDAKDFKNKSSQYIPSIIYTPVQDGKWVYFGTEDAIEDFTD